MPAEYILRFDDICPTMNWPVWHEVEEILSDFAARPLLAVIPDNRDPTLQVGPARQDFWNQVRLWQARGWAIGLHGYQHLYAAAKPGIVRINRRSEFTGLPYDEQRSKLEKAVAVFAREQITPDAWIAPAHSFDATTLQVLREMGIRCISDGFALKPYRDAQDMLWVPQQLWRFRRAPFGLWTVCLHINRWHSQDVARLRSDLRNFAAQLTDWHSVVGRYAERRRSRLDRAFERAQTAAISYRSRRSRGASRTD